MSVFLFSSDEKATSGTMLLREMLQCIPQGAPLTFTTTAAVIATAMVALVTARRFGVFALLFLQSLETGASQDQDLGRG
jgi:hypothetical protein